MALFVFLCCYADSTKFDFDPTEWTRFFTQLLSALNAFRLIHFYFYLKNGMKWIAEDASGEQINSRRKQVWAMNHDIWH